MSVGTLLQKVGTWIAGIFKKGGDILEDTVLPVTIIVTNALRGILNADTPDILGHLAGSAGAAFEDKLRDILAKIIPQLQLAQQFKGEDPATILANVLKLIGPAPAITQTAFWIEFSGMVAQAFANDGTIDLGEANAIAKYYYDNHPA